MRPVKKTSVPMVISYREVTKRPKHKKHTKFVGVRKVFKNAFGLVSGVVHDLCYEDEYEEVDPGESQVVHWALQVDDPWGPDTMSNLIVTRVPHLPEAGTHIEMISVNERPVEQLEEEISEAPSAAPENGARPQPRAPRPAQFDETRRRMREQLVRNGHFDFEAGVPE